MLKSKNGNKIIHRIIVTMLSATLFFIADANMTESNYETYSINTLSQMHVYAMNFEDNDEYISISDGISAAIETGVELNEAAKEKANTEITTDIALESLTAESAMQKIKVEEAYVKPKVMDVPKYNISTNAGYHTNINGYNIYVNPILHPDWNKSGCINKHDGTYQGPSGKETYYNLPMNGVVKIMRNMGYDETNWPYWERDDGCKMFGDYIMVAANLTIRQRGSIVETSLGTGIVCDTGSFANNNPTQLDIAVTW